MYVSIEDQINELKNAKTIADIKAIVSRQLWDKSKLIEHYRGRYPELVNRKPNTRDFWNIVRENEIADLERVESEINEIVEMNQKDDDDNDNNNDNLKSIVDHHGFSHVADVIGWCDVEDAAKERSLANPKFWVKLQKAIDLGLINKPEVNPSNDADLSVGKLRWQNKSHCGVFCHVALLGHLFLNDDDIKEYSESAWERQEIVISYDDERLYYIYMPNWHDDPDDMNLDVNSFATLSEAKKVAEEEAEILLEMRQENISEEDDRAYQETIKVEEQETYDYLVARFKICGFDPSKGSHWDQLEKVGVEFKDYWKWREEGSKVDNVPWWIWQAAFNGVKNGQITFPIDYSQCDIDNNPTVNNETFKDDSETLVKIEQNEVASVAPKNHSQKSMTNETLKEENGQYMAFDYWVFDKGYQLYQKFATNNFVLADLDKLFTLSRHWIQKLAEKFNLWGLQQPLKDLAWLIKVKFKKQQLCLI